MPQTSTAQEIREGFKRRLREHFQGFIDKAWPEEIRFLSDVLNDWENRHLDGPVESADFEMPIYGAMRENIGGAPELHSEVCELLAALELKKCATDSPEMDDEDELQCYREISRDAVYGGSDRMEAFVMEYAGKPEADVRTALWKLPAL